MAQTAVHHGGELSQAGFTLAQVVHDYGDVCQAVTELAMELDVSISTDELRTLNRCLDEAIAQAVTEHTRLRELSLSDRGTERLGFFAHELRNLLANAMLAFDVLKSGRVGVGGSTGMLLGRNLIALRDLIDRSLVAVRLEAGLQRREHVPLTQLMEEVELAAPIKAKARGLQLTVTPLKARGAIDVDRQLITAALANLLQNAFKFSRPNGHVVLRTDTTTAPGRVLIDVEDECGGLPAGQGRGPVPALRAAQRQSDRAGARAGHRPPERRDQRRRDPGPQPAGQGMHLHHRPAPDSWRLGHGDRQARHGRCGEPVASGEKPKCSQLNSIRPCRACILLWGGCRPPGPWAMPGLSRQRPANALPSEVGQCCTNS